MNPLYAAEKYGTYQSSTDAFAAIDERYAASLASLDVESWAADLGDVIPSSDLVVRLPIANLSGWGYQQTQGENRFKSFSGKYFDLKTEEFDEGYEEYLLKLQKDPIAARQWALFGERLPVLETELVNSSVGTLIEDGETTNGIDGTAFFSAAHGNLQAAATPFSLANLLTEAAAMASLVDANGKSLNVKPDTIVVPNALSYSATQALAQSLMLTTVGTSFAAVDNPFKGAFRVVAANDLTNNGAASDWYLLDSKLTAKGLPPWAIVRMAADGDLGMRRYDTDSDFFRDHSRIKVSSHVFYGFSLGFHYGIRKVSGA